MAKNGQLNFMSHKASDELRLANLLKKGKPFTVETNRERNLVLAAARFLGISVATREREQKGSYAVVFLN